MNNEGSIIIAFMISAFCSGIIVGMSFIGTAFIFLNLILGN